MTIGRVSMDRIKAAVSAEFDVPLRDLLSTSQRRECARPRQVAMALAWELTHHSNATIGRLLGRRDHTTVIHGRRRIATLRKTDPDFDDRIRRVRARLEAPLFVVPEPIQLTFLDGPLFDWIHDASRPRPTLTMLEAA